MKVKKHFKKVSSYMMVGAIGLSVASMLTGCEQREDANNINNMQNQNQGYFIVIQELPDKSYKIVEQYPTSGTTRAILKKADGTEQLLSEEELKKLTKEEARKIENGTSNLTRPDSEVRSGFGGMGLGEAILSSAAGAIIGSYIGNKLFNNSNYKSRVARQPHAVSRSATSNRHKSSRFGSSRRSGFMSGSSRRRSFGFGG